MKQQVWSSPKTSFEQFVPQNYIAACGDSGTVYKFECDAGGGTYGSVYYETNGIEGLQKESGCYCGKGHSKKRNCSNWVEEADYHRTDWFHACVNHETGAGIHEASSTSDFINGYYVVGNDVTPVVIWKGPNNDNVHCTTKLNQSDWETAKS